MFFLTFVKVCSTVQLLDYNILMTSYVVGLEMELKYWPNTRLAISFLRILSANWSERNRIPLIILLIYNICLDKFTYFIIY